MKRLGNSIYFTPLEEQAKLETMKNSAVTEKDKNTVAVRGKKTPARKSRSNGDKGFASISITKESLLMIKAVITMNYQGSLTIYEMIEKLITPEYEKMLKNIKSK